MSSTRTDTRPTTDTEDPGTDSDNERAREVLRSRRIRARRRTIIVNLLRVATFVALTGAWETASRREWIKPLFFSRPSEIWPALVDSLQADLLSELQLTLYETFVGFGLGAIAGLIIGVLLYEVPILDAVFRPFLTAFNSMPRIALAPLFVLWFGLGPASRIALVVSLVVFIVILNTYAGLQQGNQDFLMLARQLHASGLSRFRYFVLPAAIPSIFAGLQLGLVYAFLGAVAGEMLGGSGGLGGEMSTALATFRTAEFFAVLFVLVIVSVAASTAMKLLERRLLRWQSFELGTAARSH